MGSFPPRVVTFSAWVDPLVLPLHPLTLRIDLPTFPPSRRLPAPPPRRESTEKRLSREEPFISSCVCVCVCFNISDSQKRLPEEKRKQTKLLGEAPRLQPTPPPLLYVRSGTCLPPLRFPRPQRVNGARVVMVTPLGRFVPGGAEPLRTDAGDGFL